MGWDGWHHHTLLIDILLLLLVSAIKLLSTPHAYCSTSEHGLMMSVNNRNSSILKPVNRLISFPQIILRVRKIILQGLQLDLYRLHFFIQIYPLTIHGDALLLLVCSYRCELRSCLLQLSSCCLTGCLCVLAGTGK